MKPRVVIGYSSANDPAWLTKIIPNAWQIHAAVLNWGDGPGDGPDPDKIALVGRLRSAGIKIFGYLYSGTTLALRSTQPNIYGSRPLAELQAEIAQWDFWFGTGQPPLIDGFFIDEVASNAESLEYYRALIAQFSQSQGVYLNFGVVPHSSYAGLRAALCVSEHSQSGFMAETFPPWVNALPEFQKLAIIHNALTADVPKIVARLKANGIGFYCISAASGHEPQFSVGTEIFIGTLETPMPAPQPQSTSETNQANLTFQQTARILQAPPEMTMTGLPALAEKRMLELIAARATAGPRLTAIPDDQLIAELARRLKLVGQS